MVTTFNPDQVYFAIALLMFAFVSNILWSCITWKHQTMVNKQLHVLDSFIFPSVYFHRFVKTKFCCWFRFGLIFIDSFPPLDSLSCFSRNLKFLARG